MRRIQAFLLLLLIGLILVTQSNGQSISSRTIVINPDSTLQTRPEIADKFEIGEDEYITDIVRLDSGEIFLLLVDQSAAFNRTLVKYDEGKFSQRLRVFSYYPNYRCLESLGDSLFIIRSGYNEGNTSLRLLTEMDMQGNTISESNITLNIRLFGEEQFLVGADNALYLIGSSYGYEEFHLIKMEHSGSVIFDLELDSYANYVQVLPDGQIFILNSTGLESRNSNGERLWYTSLNNEDNWNLRSLQVVDDDSIYIEYLSTDFPKDWGIYRCDTEGDLMANVTLVGNRDGFEVDILVNDLMGMDETLYLLCTEGHGYNGTYLIRFSKGLEIINSWAPLIVDSMKVLQFEFNRHGESIIFVVAGTTFDRQILAYKISGTSFEIVIIAGGVILVTGIVIVIWKRYR